MSNDQDLDGIFDRIAKRNATDEDIQTLRQLLRVTEGQSVIQIGKYSVNITEGREIHREHPSFYSGNGRIILKPYKIEG
jgi:eukaryotic-like serine/threonine-protein kinase